jgi:ferric-dicitrate binding protein FerR (iron transport regulator)
MDIEALIIRYFKNKTSKEENSSLLSWLQSSDENKKLFFEMKDVWDSSLVLKNKYNKNVQWKILRRKQTDIRLRYIQKYIAVAAVALLLITVGYFMSSQTETKVKMISYNDVLTLSGEKVKLKLSDGTIVWVNSKSKFSYPTNFSGEKREVFLEGEAYFEVARNEKKPFIINTGDLNVNVLGTKFNLSAYKDDETIETSLFSGLVEIELNNNSKFKQILNPKHRAVYAKNDASISIKDVKYDMSNQWINNKLVFRDLELKKIFKKLERKFDYRIILKDPTVSEMKFTGEYDDETIEEVFEMFQFFLPIKCHLTEDKRVIVERI